MGRVTDMVEPGGTTKFPHLEICADHCTGCLLCLLACSAGKEGAFQPTAARLRIDKDEARGLDMPVVCRQCSPAPCQEACTEEAIRRDERTGALTVIQERCTGCAACQEACPYDVILMSDGTAHKCDLCRGRPFCVRWCPTGALSFTPAAEGGRAG